MLKRITSALLVLAAAFPVTLAAQEGEEGYERGQLYSVTTWEVLPAHAMKWEEAIKQVVAAAREADSPYNWYFWQEGSKYTIVFPVGNFAYFDDPEQWMRSIEGTPGEPLMQEAMAAFPTIDATVVSDELVEEKPEWSYGVEGWGPDRIKYGVIFVVWPRTGMNEEFAQLNKDWVAFNDELGYPYPYTAHEVHFGAATSRTVYVTYVDDLSEFYGENNTMKMIEAHDMGEQWEPLIGRFMEVAERFEEHTIMFRPDLSYWTEDEGATN